jgi:hypothetical protein
VRRIRIEKPKPRLDRPWLEVLPLDPRDPDVVRVKVVDREGKERTKTEGA